MPIITFFLVRHGEAEQNVENIMSSYPEQEMFHLTKKGRLQVKTTAKFLASMRIDVIFSSPLLRTRETAQIISQTLGIPIIFDERLVELGAGIFNDRPLEEFQKKYPDPILRIAPDEKDGVESIINMRGRLQNFLDSLKEKYAGKNVVIVSHGDPLEQLRGILTEESPGRSATGWMPEFGSYIKAEWKV